MSRQIYMKIHVFISKYTCVVPGRIIHEIILVILSSMRRIPYLNQLIPVQTVICMGILFQKYACKLEKLNFGQ